MCMACGAETWLSDMATDTSTAKVTDPSWPMPPVLRRAFLTPIFPGIRVGCHDFYTRRTYQKRQQVEPSLLVCLMLSGSVRFSPFISRILSLFPRGKLLSCPSQRCHVWFYQSVLVHTCCRRSYFISPSRLRGDVFISTQRESETRSLWSPDSIFANCATAVSCRSVGPVSSRSRPSQNGTIHVKAPRFHTLRSFVDGITLL